MDNQRGRAVWSVVTAIVVASSLWSLAPVRSEMVTLGCCLNGSIYENTTFGIGNCSVVPDFACPGDFSPGQVCGANSSTCVKPRQGCCDSGILDCAGGNCLGFGMCHDNISELECSGKEGNFVEDAVCDISEVGVTQYLNPGRCIPIESTPTATATPTPTATETKIPDGGSCVDPVGCVSGNCVEEVCCDSACDEPGESCTMPGSEGTCVPPPTMAPVASKRGLVMLVLGLAAVGVFMVTRRRDLGTALRGFLSL